MARKHTIVFDLKYDGIGEGGTGVLTVAGREMSDKGWFVILRL